jgi:hypothetical protein
MTIQVASTTAVDIYQRNQTRQANSNAPQYFLEFTDTVFLAWFNKPSQVNSMYHQEQRKRLVKAYTNNPAIDALVAEQTTVFVLQSDGSRYVVMSKQDCGNQGIVFFYDCEEMLTSEPLQTTPLAGDGALLAGGSVGL